MTCSSAPDAILVASKERRLPQWLVAQQAHANPGQRSNQLQQQPWSEQHRLAALQPIRGPIEGSSPTITRLSPIRPIRAVDKVFDDALHLPEAGNAKKPCIPGRFARFSARTCPVCTVRHKKAGQAPWLALAPLLS